MPTDRQPVPDFSGLYRKAVALAMLGERARRLVGPPVGGGVRSLADYQRAMDLLDQARAVLGPGPDFQGDDDVG